MVSDCVGLCSTAPHWVNVVLLVLILSSGALGMVCLYFKLGDREDK